MCVSSVLVQGAEDDLKIISAFKAKVDLSLEFIPELCASLLE